MTQEGSSQSKLFSGLGISFWIAAIIGLYTSWCMAMVLVYADAGITTTGAIIWVTAITIAIQIGSWFLGHKLFRIGHRVGGCVVLAFPMVIAFILTALGIGIFKAMGG